MAITKSKHKKPYRLIFNIILFLVITSLALFYILKDDPIAIFDSLSQVSLFPFLLALLAVIVMTLLDGIGITFLTRHYRKQYKFSQGLINAIIGNFIGCFYKTGSSFIQAYTFTKQGVKGTHAASILTMNFLIYQLTVTIYSSVMIFVGYPFVKDIPLNLLGGIKIFPLSLIGFGINILFLLLIVSLAYCKTLHRIAINVSIKVLYKLHIIKDPEHLKRKWTLQLATYRIEIRRLVHHWSLLVFVFLLQSGKQILLNTLPYLCFFSLNADMSSISYTACLASSSYLNLISSYLVIGAPEIGFQAIFTYILNNSISDAYTLASAANLLWRFLTLYLSLIVGCLCFFFYKGSPRRYELLANSATIYDLQVVNLSESDDKATKDFLVDVQAKEEKERPLLSEKEVRESFLKIKKSMAEREEDEEKVEEPETLTLQKKTLAKVLEETEELLAQNQIDPEAKLEIERFLADDKRRQEAKEKRKNERRQAKLYRETERNRKKLEKLQPHGTKVTFNEDTGLNIDGPQIYEKKTLTTHDESENEKDELDDSGEDK